MKVRNLVLGLMLAANVFNAHSAVMATGGAAYLVSKAIKSAKVLAFEDLGMEAIREYKVVDMPVTVAVDSDGNSIHHIGPKIWSEKIKEIDFKYIK